MSECRVEEVECPTPPLGEAINSDLQMRDEEVHNAVNKARELGLYTQWNTRLLN
jgi:hypothetical protein